MNSRKKKILWEKLFLRDFGVEEKPSLLKKEIDWKEEYKIRSFSCTSWNPQIKSKHLIITNNGKTIHTNISGKWTTGQIGNSIPKRGIHQYEFDVDCGSVIIGVAETSWDHDFDGGYGNYPGQGNMGSTSGLKDGVFSAGFFGTISKVTLEMNMETKKIQWFFPDEPGKVEISSFEPATKPVFVVCSILSGTHITIVKYSPRNYC